MCINLKIAKVGIFILTKRLLKPDLRDKLKVFFNLLASFFYFLIRESEEFFGWKRRKRITELSSGANKKYFVQCHKIYN